MAYESTALTSELPRQGDIHCPQNNNPQPFRLDCYEVADASQYSIPWQVVSSLAGAARQCPGSVASGLPRLPVWAKNSHTPNGVWPIGSGGRIRTGDLRVMLAT